MFQIFIRVVGHSNSIAHVPLESVAFIFQQHLEILACLRVNVGFRVELVQFYFYFLPTCWWSMVPCNLVYACVLSQFSFEAAVRELCVLLCARSSVGSFIA